MVVSHSWLPPLNLNPNLNPNLIPCCIRIRGEIRIKIRIKIKEKTTQKVKCPKPEQNSKTGLRGRGDGTIVQKNTGERAALKLWSH